MAMRREHHGSGDQGIALLIVLWILTILMLLVFSFSYMARTETYATIAFKSGTEEKFFAEAGLERGIMEVFYRQFYKDQTVDIEGREIWRTDDTPYQGQIGDGLYTVRITNEQGKVDINTASEVVLKNLFINMGVQAEEADTIVDSIMDWKDPDDLHRIHGAESDYYMSLPNPYKAKNADFDTLEELLLVKGMTSEILYGTKDKKGAIDFLTINSGQGEIDINAAPKEVLMSIPGITAGLADAIIDKRKDTEIKNLAEFALPQESLRYVSAGEGGSAAYTIDSIGSRGNQKGGYAIRATVKIAGQDDYKIVYYKSPATIEP
ncbi:MAG TPA: type II secretion system protein GspK [Thermodesulfovibrionales bacterium]|nr:type II secretion system protein GspK [Thermodesulfovibrionales bacterium]